MKLASVLLLLSLPFTTCKAGNPYRTYLLMQASNLEVPKQTIMQPVNEKSLTIPRYHIPAGSVFCRLEDKLTKATKVWVKIGVQ